MTEVPSPLSTRRSVSVGASVGVSVGVSLGATTLALGLLAGALVACEAPPPEPTPEKKPAEEASAKAATISSTPRVRPKPAKKKISAKPVAEVPVSDDDPLKGKWSLEDATQGLPKEGALFASIKTGLGTLECRLYEDKAPITVANFVGLARGLRPYKLGGEWVKKPGYDGTQFHRIIKGFMIQGGSMTGSDETGYVIPDEIWEDAYHDRPGLLCMANRGKNTNSKQFFITHGAPAHLDGGYTIFGECTPLSVVDELAGVPTKGEKPVDPPKIESITITRKVVEGAPAGSSSATASSAEPGASAAPSASAAASAKPSASAASGAAPKK